MNFTSLGAEATLGGHANPGLYRRNIVGAAPGAGREAKGGPEGAVEFAGADAVRSALASQINATHPSEILQQGPW
jgi:hypothetical protein